MSVIIIIMDRNDNNPVWTSTFSSLTIPEVRLTFQLFAVGNLLLLDHNRQHRVLTNLAVLISVTTHWNGYFYSNSNRCRLWIQWPHHILLCVSTCECFKKEYNVMEVILVLLTFPVCNTGKSSVQH